jgi:hypothetical protein
MRNSTVSQETAGVPSLDARRRDKRAVPNTLDSIVDFTLGPFQPVVTTDQIVLLVRFYFLAMGSVKSLDFDPG